jgi:hypothetical protein
MFKFFSYVQVLVMIFVFQVKFISICTLVSRLSMQLEPSRFVRT